MAAVIETERLTKSYGEHRGIIELDLEVGEGEVFGFLGPNGAGKTTTMRDPARPHPADERPGRGVRHRHDGRSGRHPSAGRLPAGRVRPVRPAHRRPDDRLLREPARRRRPGLCRRADRAPRPRHEPAVQASTRKGNKQKVGLVVALQHRPDLLILDEPTAGLDPLVQQTFFELVREAAPTAGRSSCRRTSSTRSTAPAIGSRSSARAGSSRSTGSRRIRELAFHHVELTFAGPVAPAELRGPAGRQRHRGRRRRRRMRVSGPIGAVIAAAAAARHRRRRQPRAEPRGRLPRPVRRPPGRRRRRRVTDRTRGSSLGPAARGRGSPASAPSTARPSATAGGRRCVVGRWSRRCS